MKKNDRNILIILSLIFIMIMILMLTGNISWFDNTIYKFIIGFKSDTLTSTMKFITVLANPEIIIFLSIISLLTLIFKYKGSIYLILTIITSTIINFITKIIIKRDRPNILRLIEETGYSFPSGHAMGSMCFYGFIIFLINKLNINIIIKRILEVFLSILIFFIGISRVYLGVHYASDIICGFILGFIILIIVKNIIEKRQIKL